MKMPFRSFNRKAEFDRYRQTSAAEFRARRAYENTLAAEGPEFFFDAYCSVCGTFQPMKVDLLWGDGRSPNWRERLECPNGMNNRIRAGWHFLVEEFNANILSTIYITEQITPLYAQLKRVFPGTIGSEFLRDGTLAGATNSRGIRHEDITALSFPEESFDFLLTFDVLEHVPGYESALREIIRVLRPGGHMLATFPFDLAAAQTVVRASIGPAGEISHLLPPEYHGDPNSPDGCLCFQIFGWDLLEKLRYCGFSRSSVIVYWQPMLGFLGGEQIMITAVK